MNTLGDLRLEAYELSKCQKHYKLQSEFHRLMYAKMLEIEILEKHFGEEKSGNIDIVHTSKRKKR